MVVSRVTRDHGGRIDDAVERYGGQRPDWIDLSTGINPVPYPFQDIPSSAWTELPDSQAMEVVLQAARRFWSVPSDLGILAAPGASALIARLPALWPAGQVRIDEPTYNEHRASFEAQGWTINQGAPAVRVVVHPNNPDGRLWDGSEPAPMTIIDESFCDVMPEQSYVTKGPADRIILKSFGKFWGLAGARLGFVIAKPDVVQRLAEMIGPWPVPGPTLEIARHALCDHAWADATRQRLSSDAERLDKLMNQRDAKLLGGTTLFRLYSVPNATEFQERLARRHIWSRIFPYSDRFLRLGLPGLEDWDRVEAAL